MQTDWLTQSHLHHTQLSLRQVRKHQWYADVVQHVCKTTTTHSTALLLFVTYLYLAESCSSSSTRWRHSSRNLCISISWLQTIDSSSPLDSTTTHNHTPLRHTITRNYDTQQHATTTHNHTQLRHTATRHYDTQSHATTTHSNTPLRHTITHHYDTQQHATTTHSNTPLRHTITRHYDTQQHATTTHSNTPLRHTITRHYDTQSPCKVTVFGKL